jgi:crotonobetainyl-CoA:carnitine CoA-transferase CaiB-like acyl-CoA transferase
VLQAVFQEQPAQHWVQLLNDAGVPAQPINNMSARPLSPPSRCPSPLTKLPSGKKCLGTSRLGRVTWCCSTRTRPSAPSIALAIPSNSGVCERRNCTQELTRLCSRTPASIRRHPPMLDEHRAEVDARVGSVQAINTCDNDGYRC